VRIDAEDFRRYEEIREAILQDIPRTRTRTVNVVTG